MFTRKAAVTQRGGYGVMLCAPDEYWDASPSDLEKMCNGCGSKKSGWMPDLVPDTMYGLDIKDACNAHDVVYAVGRTLADKEQGDREFLNNLLRLIEKAPSRAWLLIGPALTMLRRRRALKYYEAVVAFGGPAFWSNKS